MAIISAHKKVYNFLCDAQVNINIRQYQSVESATEWQATILFYMNFIIIWISIRIQLIFLKRLALQIGCWIKIIYIRVYLASDFFLFSFELFLFYFCFAFSNIFWIFFINGMKNEDHTHIFSSFFVFLFLEQCAWRMLRNQIIHYWSQLHFHRFNRKNHLKTFQKQPCASKAITFDQKGQAM